MRTSVGNRRPFGPSRDDFQAFTYKNTAGRCNVKVALAKTPATVKKRHHDSKLKKSLSFDSIHTPHNQLKGVDKSQSSHSLTRNKRPRKKQLMNSENLPNINRNNKNENSKKRNDNSNDPLKTDMQHVNRSSQCKSQDNIRSPVRKKSSTTSSIESSKRDKNATTKSKHGNHSKTLKSEIEEISSHLKKEIGKLKTESGLPKAGKTSEKKRRKSLSDLSINASPTNELPLKSNKSFNEPIRTAPTKSKDDSTERKHESFHMNDESIFTGKHSSPSNPGKKTPVANKKKNLKGDKSGSPIRSKNSSSNYVPSVAKMDKYTTKQKDLSQSKLQEKSPGKSKHAATIISTPKTPTSCNKLSDQPRNSSKKSANAASKRSEKPPTSPRTITSFKQLSNEKSHSKNQNLNLMKQKTSLDLSSEQNKGYSIDSKNKKTKTKLNYRNILSKIDTGIRKNKTKDIAITDSLIKNKEVDADKFRLDLENMLEKSLLSDSLLQSIHRISTPDIPLFYSSIITSPSPCFSTKKLLDDNDDVSQCLSPILDRDENEDIAFKVASNAPEAFYQQELQHNIASPESVNKSYVDSKLSTIISGEEYYPYQGHNTEVDTYVSPTHSLSEENAEGINLLSNLLIDDVLDKEIQQIEEKHLSQEYESRTPIERNELSETLGQVEFVLDEITKMGSANRLSSVLSRCSENSDKTEISQHSYDNLLQKIDAQRENIVREKELIQQNIRHTNNVLTMQNLLAATHNNDKDIKKWTEESQDLLQKHEITLQKILKYERKLARLKLAIDEIKKQKQNLQIRIQSRMSVLSGASTPLMNVPHKPLQLKDHSFFNPLIEEETNFEPSTAKYNHFEYITHLAKNNPYSSPSMFYEDDDLNESSRYSVSDNGSDSSGILIGSDNEATTVKVDYSCVINRDKRVKSKMTITSDSSNSYFSDSDRKL